MRYLIEHETRLTFSEPVVEHQCEVRLAPLEHPHQRVHALRVDVEPAARLFSYIDAFGNQVHHFGVLAPHAALRTWARSEVETLLDNPFDYVPVARDRERAWVNEALRAQPRLWDFVLHRSAATPALDTLARDGLKWPAHDPARPLIESVIVARDWIAETLRYASGATAVHSPLAEVIGARQGVCQDFAHLLITVVRAWGFPARYVMGYQDSDGDADDDARPSPHAWAEVLIPGAGWRGFDATAALVVNDRYVAVAVGRDSLDAAPQRGSFKGPDEKAPPEVALRLVRQQ
jgi:transglutaminase-like putative cysteine protease